MGKGAVDATKLATLIPGMQFMVQALKVLLDVVSQIGGACFVFSVNADVNQGAENIALRMVDGLAGAGRQQKKHQPKSAQKPQRKS